MAPSLSSFNLRSVIIRLAAVQPQLVTVLRNQYAKKYEKGSTDCTVSNSE